VTYQKPTAYRVEDHELLLGFYQRILWDWLVPRFPASLSPNALTIRWAAPGGVRGGRLRHSDPRLPRPLLFVGAPVLRLPHGRQRRRAPRAQDRPDEPARRVPRPSPRWLRVRFIAARVVPHAARRRRRDGEPLRDRWLRLAIIFVVVAQAMFVALGANAIAPSIAAGLSPPSRGRQRKPRGARRSGSTSRPPGRRACPRTRPCRRCCPRLVQGR